VSADDRDRTNETIDAFPPVMVTAVPDLPDRRGGYRTLGDLADLGITRA